MAERLERARQQVRQESEAEARRYWQQEAERERVRREVAADMIVRGIIEHGAWFPQDPPILRHEPPAWSWRRYWPSRLR